MSSPEESFIILGSGPSSMEQSMSIINSLPNGGINGDHEKENQPPESLSSFKSAVDRAKGETFASKFLLEEIGQEQLMSSVFQQFPSINTTRTDANDVVKLYNLLDEHAQLKENLQKTNEHMKTQFSSMVEWRERVKLKIDEKQTVIAQLEQRLDEREVQTLDAIKSAQEAEKKVLNAFELLKAVENEKQELIKMNQDLRLEMREAEERHNTTIEVLKSEIDANVMTISEKDSIIRNVHEQIQKLSHDKDSLVFVHSHELSAPDAEMMLKSEHTQKIREINRQLSVLAAQNLEMTDMKTMYTDEINCLKVNLTSAEELIKQLQATVKTLQASNTENSKRAAQAERDFDTARQRIDLLNAQVDIYRNDFQAEREAREKLASEKDSLTADLNLLQRRNKELIEEAQKQLGTPPGPSTGAVRKTPPQSKENTPETEDVIRYICPVCNIETKTLRLLEQHIEGCLLE